MNRLFAVLVSSTFALGSLAAHAHHSFSGTFQQDKTIQVTGVVTDFRFVNPHMNISFNVTNPDGTVTQWRSEGGAANLYRRAGWSKDTLKVGDMIRISGSATRDGTPMISSDKIELMNPKDMSVARELPRGGGGATQTTDLTPPKVAALPLQLSDGRPNLTGTWTQNFGARRGGGPGAAGPPGAAAGGYGAPPAAAATGRAGGRGPQASTVPFNEAGAALQAKYDPANDPQIFCDPPGLVRQAGFTPHSIKLTQLADRVVFDYEEYGGHREVLLAPHKIVSRAKSNLGDSIAHYEGDSLIIESKNLLSNLTSPQGNRLSDKMTTVETYRRADDPVFGPTLSIQMVVTDPVYLQAPLTMKSAKIYTENYEFLPNDCRPPMRKRPAELTVSSR